MSTYKPGSKDFDHSGAGCGGAQCGDQGGDTSVNSWYEYLDKITQNPAQLWECSLPSKVVTPMTKPT